ncbi:hypothetical protein [Pseudomonas sp. A-B-19]|uniref:hypothetical protein n=1 Tax=Pseudomonas sp. A-B-19 TaxID=2832405 RepID=UPI001CBFC5D7|nr:hypothetical protein [Pseudomonas sp. A-B-19]
MNRATPPCNSIALLLRSNPPCAMHLTLTTANTVPLDDVGAQFILPVILMYSFRSDYALRAKGRMGDGFL